MKLNAWDRYVGMTIYDCAYARRCHNDDGEERIRRDEEAICIRPSISELSNLTKCMQYSVWNQKGSQTCYF